MESKLHLGKNPLRVNLDPVKGKQVTLAGEAFYQIANYDRMRPFFMTVVSDADHWLFISSNGALTAGRKDPDHALFPYYTDDRIHDSQGQTGSTTLLRVRRDGQDHLWEPFPAATRACTAPLAAWARASTATGSTSKSATTTSA